MQIVTPALIAAGVQVAALALSTSSFRRYRNMNRESAAQNIQNDFKPEVSLVLHFDGKMPPDENGNSKRLAVYVTGKNIAKLIFDDK